MEQGFGENLHFFFVQIDAFLLALIYVVSDPPTKLNFEDFRFSPVHGIPSRYVSVMFIKATCSGAVATYHRCQLVYEIN